MNKIVLIGIAILAVGLIALPQTFALFAGQHDWYNTDGQNVSAIPCLKCHADVRLQMDAMGAGAPHSGDSGYWGGSDGCINCHVASATNPDRIGGFAVVGGGNEPDTTMHAAAAPMCLDCHGDNILGTTYLGAPKAVSIFGPQYNGNTSIEVHGEFVYNASADAETLLKGANEACIGCHTHVGVNASWVKPTMLSFRAEVSTAGTWTVSNFRADAGYNNTAGAPVGIEPYNENTGIAVINEAGTYIPAP